MNGGTKNLFSGNYFPLDVIQGIFESATGAIFGRIVNLLLSLCLTFVRLNLFTQPKFWPITIISQNHCKTNLVFWEYIHFENIFSILKANKTRIILLWLQMALKGSWQCILRCKIFKKTSIYSWVGWCYSFNINRKVQRILTLTNHGFLCSYFWYMSSFVRSTWSHIQSIHIAILYCYTVWSICVAQKRNMKYYYWRWWSISFTDPHPRSQNLLFLNLHQVQERRHTWGQHDMQGNLK